MREAGSWEKAGVDLEIKESGTNRPKLSKRRGEASIREMGKAGKGFFPQYLPRRACPP
jgi:hypothetical protein